MPKRSSKKQTDQVDNNTVPDAEVNETTAAGKDPAAVALGRKGGKKGGPARAKKLTKEERSAIARKAAEARWKRQQSE